MLINWISLAAIDGYTQVHVKWWRKMLQVAINFYKTSALQTQQSMKHPIRL